MEHLKTLNEKYPLYDGFTWKYYLTEYTTSVTQWDKLQIINPRGNKVCDDIIHDLRYYYSWEEAAQNCLSKLRKEVDIALYREEQMGMMTVADSIESDYKRILG